jgi:hypothetical protein
MILNATCKKVKLSHYHCAGDKGERRYSSYSVLTKTLDGGEGQHHARLYFTPWGRDPQYPLYRRLGGPQSWSGHRG